VQGSSHIIGLSAVFENGDVLIQKFGGSSMGSCERIKKVAARVAKQAARGFPMVVVVSAMGDTTDALISLMGEITETPVRRELDAVLATGEMVSASLAASALIDLGVNARSFNAFNLQLYSALEGPDYNIVEIGRRRELCEFLKTGGVAVVAGFQGITTQGELTTLGRGGSDLTAVILARELGQKVCEKYTDEDGIYTADPRLVPDAVKVWHINYDEMLALARGGNGILHPRAISTAQEHKIRLHVRSSFNNEEGSVVCPDGDSLLPVKSLSIKRLSQGIASVSIVGNGLLELELRDRFIASVAELAPERVEYNGIGLAFYFSELTIKDAVATLHNQILLSRV
jgi:aspartate kinase